jgi:WD40 repeat protein/serine/threonine protein kinase
MSPEDRERWEEEFADLLAAGDEALAAGKPADLPSTTELPEEREEELKEELAYLQAVREALCPPRSAKADGGCSELPWTTLGQFEIRRELGRGGFGVVYLAYDPKLRREVALKVPRPEILITPELRERFHREARAAAGLQHPNLVPVYEVGEAGAICFLVSAYCPGPTLADWLRHQTQAVPYRDSATLVALLADAVHHAHCHGVVHRDLKPANVLLAVDSKQQTVDSIKDKANTSAEEHREDYLPPSSLLSTDYCLLSTTPMITDFGLAKQIHTAQATDDKTLTRAGAVVGTASYMAPEQAGGRVNEIGPAVDIYALGAILYELLTGRPPFQGDSDVDTLMQVQAQDPIAPSRIRPRVPRDLETICLKCLEKEPPRRYATALELAEDLRRFLAGEPIRARPVGHIERTVRWCYRKPAQAAVVGLSALGVVFLTAFLVSYSFADRLRAEQARTKKALHEAEIQHDLAQQLSARLAMERGLFFCEQGDAGRGMLWLARSLEIVPSGGIDLEQEIRMNLAGWQHQLHHLRAVLTHRLPIRKVVFSPDGRLMATASHDRTAQLWEARTGKRHGSPLGHEGSVERLAFSPDGMLLATASHDGKARLWDPRTCRCMSAFKHATTVWAVAFSPDGKLLATRGDDETICMWDIRTGKRRDDPLPAKGLNIKSFGFSPDSKTLLVSGRPGTALLWDTAAGKARGSPIEITGGQRSQFAFSPDGRMLATGGRGLTPRFWDALTGEPLTKPITGSGLCRMVIFSPDGRLVASENGAGTVRLWDAPAGREHGPPLQHASLLWDLQFSPDGKRLVTGAEDGTARVWDPDTSQPIGMPLRMDDRIEAVAFSPDGRTVLLGAYSGIAQLWELGPGMPPSRVLPHGGRVRSGVFGADGRTIFTGSDDGTAWLWDAVTARPIVGPLRHNSHVGTVAISPDGKKLLTGSVDKSARLWDAESGKQLATLNGFKDSVSRVAFSPDGKLVMTASYDGTVRFWDADTGEPIGQPLRHDKEIVVATFSPDGGKLLTGGEDQVARLWDVATRRQIGPDLKHGSGINAGAFSSDGRVAATASDDKAARLWDTATGRPIGEPLRHKASVNALAFSPDGKTLLTASADWTARLWDVDTGEPLGPVFSHQGQVLAAAFSPDGHAVATASSDSTARLWDAASGSSLGPAMRHQGAVWAIGLSPDGQTIFTGSADNTARIWPRPASLSGSAERIVVWAQVDSGMELDEAGNVHLLEPDEWQKRRQRLAELGGPPVGPQ